MPQFDVISSVWCIFRLVNTLIKYAYVYFTSDDGTLRVVSSNTESEQEEQLWTSSSKCPVRYLPYIFNFTVFRNVLNRKVSHKTLHVLEK